MDSLTAKIRSFFKKKSVNLVFPRKIPNFGAENDEKRFQMDNKKNKSAFDREREILFSQTVKAGKRIYYLDVKRNRNDEMFLSITESKKVYAEPGSDDGQYTFEKHKIFLYREDFGKFITALTDALRFIHANDTTPIRTHDTDDDESAAVDNEAGAENAELPDVVLPEGEADDENALDESDFSSKIDISIDF